MLLPLLSRVIDDDAGWLQPPAMMVFKQRPASVVASSQTPGFPALSVLNPLTYDMWIPSAYPASLSIDYGAGIAVDAIGLACYQVGGSVKVEYSLDGTSWTVAAYPQLQDAAALVRIPLVTARYWRVTLSDGKLGVIAVGRMIGFECGEVSPTGTTPLMVSRQTELMTNSSSHGMWLGRSIRKQGLAGQIQLDYISVDKYRFELDPALRDARLAPFFIDLPFDGHQYYCWTTADPKPTRQTGGFISVAIAVEAYTDE